MKKTINPNTSEWATLIQRPTQNFAAIEETVLGIFKEVQQKGDVAVAKYTSFFDGIELSKTRVSEVEIKEGISLVSEELKEAIKQAKANIEAFHNAQKTARIEIETTEGVTCWQEKRPIQKIGLYIPGGTAPLISTDLMLAIRAQLVGCKTFVLTSRPNTSGKFNPAICYGGETGGDAIWSCHRHAGRSFRIISNC